MALPGSGEEFRRGPQLTLALEANPEEIAFLKRWSDEIPTLYFLDICAVNLTKFSREAVKRFARKTALFDRLKELDRPQNGFSYLLVLMEKVNDTRSELSNAVLEEQILRDIAALRAFFINARVVESNEFLVGYARNLRKTPYELSQPAYIQFLRAANDQFALSNPVARQLRLQRAEEILKKADALSIVRQHPVVLVTLGCLYGNRSAMKVMKFKVDPAKFKVENALADIMIIQRYLTHKLRIEQLWRERQTGYLRCKFITDDGGLANFLKCFEGEAVRSEPGGDKHRMHITLNVSLELLFPELLTQTVPSEADKLCKLLAS